MRARVSGAGLDSFGKAGVIGFTALLMFDLFRQSVPPSVPSASLMQVRLVLSWRCFGLTAVKGMIISAEDNIDFGAVNVIGLTALQNDRFLPSFGIPRHLAVMFVFSLLLAMTVITAHLVINISTKLTDLNRNEHV